MVAYDIRCEEAWVIARRLRRETNELLELSYIGIIFGGCHALDGLGTIRNCCHDFVGITNLWIRDVLVMQVNSICESLASHALDMAIVYAIVGLGCEKVPAIDGMIVPRATFVGLIVNLNRALHRCERHFVVIERSAKMRVRRNGGRCIFLIGGAN